jgi:uncharacterized protein (TIGR03435 family)
MMKVISVLLKLAHLPKAKQRAFTMAGVVAVGLFTQMVAVCGRAQEAKTAGDSAFDVVSVKPSGTATVRIPSNVPVVVRGVQSFTYAPGKLTCNETFAGFLLEAYSGEPWKIHEKWQVSGPSWLTEDTYEFAARMPVGTTKDMARSMLRTVLAERFGLKFHLEQTEISAYGLVEGKGGSKLQEVPNPGGSSGEQGPGRFSFSAIPLEDFASVLTLAAGRPVIDMTGLKGTYKIDLKWEVDYEDNMDGGRGDRGMLTVLDQLGLKLEKRKVPASILVIDHVDRTPTPN